MKSLKERLEEKIEDDAYAYRKRIQKQYNTIESDIKPSIDFSEGAESLVPLVLELAEAIKYHHEVWGIGDECFAECAKLCKALQSIEKFLEGK